MTENKEPRLIDEMRQQAAHPPLGIASLHLASALVVSSLDKRKNFGHAKALPRRTAGYRNPDPLRG
jgi:hypothetical protein